MPKAAPKTTPAPKTVEEISERLKALEKEAGSLSLSRGRTPKNKARREAIEREEESLVALFEVTDITLAGKYLGLSNLGASIKLPTNEKTLRRWVGQTEADYSYEMNPSGELNEWIRNIRKRDLFATMEIAKGLPFLIRVR